MRVLFIGAHTDDVEISCGGTIAKFLEHGHRVAVLACSQQFSELNLLSEFEDAMKVLNPSVYWAHYFRVRHFDSERQKILDFFRTLIEDCDMVFCHDNNDVHQDHSTIGFEAVRAFKTQSIFMYASPFNSLAMDENYHIEISEAHLEKKLAALACYKSQQHRAYMAPKVVRANAIIRGLQSGFKYAEAFKVVKLRDSI